MDLHTLFNRGHCFNFMTMRNIFVTEKGSETSLNAWEFETPKEIRAGAIKEMTARLSQNASAIKKGQITRFQMRLKSRKRSPSECITIPKVSIKVKKGFVSIYSTKLTPIKLGKRHGKKCKYSDTIEMDSRLHYDGVNFFLLIPKAVRVKDRVDANRVVGLDPGKRVFQTGFSETESQRILKQT